MGSRPSSALWRLSVALPACWMVEAGGSGSGEMSVNLTSTQWLRGRTAEDFRHRLAQETPCLGHLPFTTNFSPSYYLGFPHFLLKNVVIMSFPICMSVAIR